MSNLPRTPPADRRLVDQEQNAEIGVAFDVLADETRQLVLDSEEIAASRLRLSGSSQPVPQVTMDLLSSILQSFQETLLDIIDKRLSDESTINLRHGGNGMRDRFEAISSPIAQNSRHPLQTSPLVSGMHGFMGPSGPTPVQSPAPNVKLERSVHHGKYQKITLISSELSTKFRISSTDKSFDNLTALARALGASNLLSLVDGSRLIPEPTMDNANGYTPSSITESTDPLSMNKFVVIDEDDIFRYAAEETTAFRFIESFLQLDMKHILAKSVKRKDPRQLYQDIQDHFRGNQFHHVDKAIKNICKHKVHPSSFERDISNFRIYISDLTHAQNVEVPEPQKFAYLKALLTQDNRHCVATAMDMAHFNKLDFDATLDLLIASHANQPAGSIRMAAMGGVGLCFAFQKGECTRKNCRYLHRLMNDQEKLESQVTGKQEKGIPNGKKYIKKEKVNSMKNNNSNGTNGMHNNTRNINNSIPLTREHQVRVGTPRGVSNSSNPNGYSAFQRKLMSSLQKSDINVQSMANSNSNILNGQNMFNNNNVNNGNFETWNNVSLQPFNNNNNHNNHNMNNNTYMNMFEAENNIEQQFISISDIKVNSTLLSPMLSRKDPTRAEYIDENEEYKRSFKSIKGGNVMTSACLHSQAIGNKFGVYVNEDRILKCRRSTTDKSKARYYCNLFNWIKSPFMENIPRNYMHQGHNQFMMAIYMHNQVVFSANVFFPYKRLAYGAFYYNKNAFMLFRPKDLNKYDRPYGENGHYSTSIKNIHTYYEIRDDFNRQPWMSLGPNARKFFMVCLYYDFMSLAEQQLEDVSRNLKLDIEDTRKYLLNKISELDIQYGAKYNEMSVIFGSIVALINPRAQFVTDKENWFQTQADISLPLYTAINEQSDYDFNDTTTLMKNNAMITSSSYQSPRNERRGRDEQDKNISNKKRKLAIKPVRQYQLDDFVDEIVVDKDAATKFCPSSPIVSIPLVTELFTSTEDQATIKNVNREWNHIQYVTDNVMRKQLMMEGYLTDENDEDSDDDSDDESVIENEKDEKSVNMFIVPNGITMSSMSSSTSWLIDSGAGLSGTNNRNLLSCPSTCRVPITPAFGEMITATSEGSIRDPRLGQLNIRALHVDKMHHNLLSVHQLCEGGESRTKQVGVFTDEGCRFFPLNQCRDALKLLSSKPQTFYGLAQNGVYIYAPSDQSK